MKVLYLSCQMGASGDMLMGALSELTDQNAFLNIMNHAGIPHVSFSIEDSEKCGIHGTHMKVLVNDAEEMDHHEMHEHHHASLSHILSVIGSLSLSDSVKQNAKQVYQLIAEAESHVHHTQVSEIHFHEVGTLDAVADVCGCCELFELIQPDLILCSPVATGSGTVECAHGILPVPAPAAAYLIQNMPVYEGSVKSELLTPTGAALLKHFVNRFETMPVIKIQKIGYGMGKKDFPEANCLRAFLGEVQDEKNTVTELVTSIDDMTAEEIGYACEVLRKAGALDVYTSSIYMKKNRPGTLVTVLCRNEQAEEMTELMFQHLSTIGIRRYETKRVCLKRHEETVQEGNETIHLKISEGYGTVRCKYEYDDLVRLAQKKGRSLAEIKEEIRNGMKK